MAFLTMPCAKLVPLPSQTNLTRWQSLPDSVGELELVFRKMQPYFCATWEMALATPECTAPIRNAASLRVIMRSAMREPVAGVVSVSMWIASMRRPSTPPLSLNSLIAIIAPRRSSPPLAAYWPEASIVRPMTSGLAVAAWAQTRLCVHGPKKGVAPASATPVALRTLRRVGLRVSFIVVSCRGFSAQWAALAGWMGGSAGHDRCVVELLLRLQQRGDVGLAVAEVARDHEALVRGLRDRARDRQR